MSHVLTTRSRNSSDCLPAHIPHHLQAQQCMQRRKPLFGTRRRRNVATNSVTCQNAEIRPTSASDAERTLPSLFVHNDQAFHLEAPTFPQNPPHVLAPNLSRGGTETLILIRNLVPHHLSHLIDHLLRRPLLTRGRALRGGRQASDRAQLPTRWDRRHWDADVLGRTRD